MQEDTVNSSGTTKEHPDLFKRSLRSGAWVVALRIFTQVLNVVRLTILLRLLAPHDFGLLGIGALLIGIMATFTETGLQPALVQRKDCTAGHLNVVWTVGIARALIICCMLYFVAPYIVPLFDGSGKFVKNHITKPAELIVTLRDSQEPLPRYLVRNFSEPTRKMLDEYDEASGVSESLHEALIDEMNKVVESVSLYDKDRFAPVELSGYALKLASVPDENRDNIRFNRRLLEEAFPDKITRTTLDRSTAALVIQVLGLSMLLGALSNVGMIYFVKDLEFGRRVVLDVTSMLVSTTVTIALAFLYMNVWALVFGRLAGRITSCILSYVIHPYRPRLSFDLVKAKELWGFGKHMLGISILKFLCVHGDDAFLGAMLGATALGFYQKAFEIGTLVATEIGNRVASVAFPAYSKLQDDLARLRDGYFKVLRMTSLLVFPAAGGLIVLAPELVETMFGAKWLPMVPAMQILCLVGPLKCMQREPVFMAIGRPDILTKLTFLRFVLMALAIYPLTVKFGMVGTALCVVGTAPILQPIAFYQLQKLVGMKVTDIFKLLSYPVGATVIMMLCVFGAKMQLEDVGIVSLVLLICLGIASYLISILAMSKISKEYDVVALVRDVARGFK